MSFAGVEEAGRGPVIGPMVMAILWTKSNETLRAVGARDSKLLRPQQREQVYRELQRLKREQRIGFTSIQLTPEEIDTAVMSADDNLNRLEARTTARLIERIVKRERIARAILDSPQRSTDKYVALVTEELIARGVKAPKLQAEVKADLNHVVVGAASIIAKVERDRAIKKLHAEVGVDFGSGYPSDPATQRFLRAHYATGRVTHLFRKSWASFRDLVEGAAQRTLVGFTEQGKHEGVKKEFAALTQHGYAFVEPKSQYEVLRMKGPGATVIKYTTGKLVVQGRAKPETEQLLKKYKLK